MEFASRAAISRWNLFSQPLSFLHSEDFQIRRRGVATQLPFGMHMTTTPSVIASSDSVGTSSQSNVLLRAGPKFGVLSNSADFRVHEECPRYGAYRNGIIWENQKAFGDCFKERHLGSFRVMNLAGRGGGGGTRGSSKKGTEDVSKDHYRVLGLCRHATAPAIKTAYRQLARQYHPDVNKDSDADNKFKSIRLAYEVLSNEASRKTYDNVLQDQANVLRQKHVVQQRDIRNKRYSRARSGHHDNMQNYSRVTSSAVDGDYSGFTMTCGDFSRGPGAAGFRQKDLDLDEDVISKHSKRGTNCPKDLKIEWEKVSREVVLFVWVISALWHALGAQTALSLLVGVISLWRNFAPGYRVASAVAWLVGGEKGLGLAVAIAVTMRIFGKVYHTAAATLVLALWLGGEFLKAIPLPQGAILVMAYKCICLQSSYE
ncbi:unnamed protein product [Sphagnum balticum]